MNHTKIAPSDPARTTHRQPCRPSGCCGTSHHESSATDGQRGETHDLAESDRAAAQFPRHQLGDVSVYRDQLDADANAGDHAPQDDSVRRVLKSHLDRRGGVPQQRSCENQMASETIRHETENQRADKQSRESGGDEAGEPVEAEKRGGGAGEKSAAHQSRPDVGSEK